MKHCLGVVGVAVAILSFSGSVLGRARIGPPAAEPASLSKLSRVSGAGAVGAGALLFRDISGDFLRAPTVETDVEIHVTGMIGRTRVVQSFRNSTDEWQEGIYVFPLPERAAVDALRMKIGERVIEGQIQERQRAKQTYEKAKSEGKKSALVEQERPNLFTMSVANIGPNENITVELEYQEDIRYDSGRFELRFPMVVAPRYIPGESNRSGTETSRGDDENPTGWLDPTDEVPDADRITPPVAHPSLERVHSVHISAELRAGMPLSRIESPSHEITVNKKTGYVYDLSLEAGSTLADRDFVLSWTPEVRETPRAALFTERLGRSEYALLMILPPEGEPQSLPRETIFVIDTSGSMHGASMEQARQALLLALDRLSPADRFNVIQFNSTTHRLFDQPVDASQNHLNQAKRYVRGLASNGGTEMRSALEAALSQDSDIDDHRVSQVVFITDGSVGNESALFSFIQSNLGERRLFTVGIGSAPNSHFMTRAAQFGRGTFTYVGSTGEVSEKIIELFRKIESPVLSNVELAWSDHRVETWPKRVPDLYTGEPLVVAARIPTGEITLRVNGTLGGSPWNTVFRLEDGASRSGVSKLWARRKIAALMDALVINGSEANLEAVRGEIVEIGIEHHLVSKYTSLVAVDVTKTAPVGAAMTRAVPSMLPAGWSYGHVFGAVGTLPQGSTSAGLFVLLGFLALIAAMFLRWNRDDSCRKDRSVFS